MEEKTGFLNEIVKEVEMRLEVVLESSFFYFLSDFYDYINIIANDRGIELNKDRLKLVLKNRLTLVYNEDETGAIVSGIKHYSQTVGDVSESYTFNGTFRSPSDLYLSIDEERILGLRKSKIRVIGL